MLVGQASCLPVARGAGILPASLVSNPELVRAPLQVVPVSASTAIQRLVARNVVNAEGKGDSNIIVSPETGCSKPNNLA